MISLAMFMLLTVSGILQAAHLINVLDKFDLFFKCASDADCQDRLTCHEGRCENCIKCGLIFRKGNDCMRDFKDCGDCMEGYEAIAVTDDSSIKKPCRPVKEKVKKKECINDTNCPPNNYCSEGFCIKCFECSLVNRWISEKKKCARGPEDCGSCMKGAVEVLVTSEENVKMCKWTSTRPPYPREMQSSAILISLFCFGITGAVILFTKLAYENYEARSSMKSVYCSHNRSPSTRTPPSAPPSHRDVGNCEEVKGGNSEISEQGSPGDNSAQPVEVSTPVAFNSAILLSRSLSESNFFVLDMDSKNEQPGVVSSNSSESNPDLVTEDAAQVPEIPAEECSKNVPPS